MSDYKQYYSDTAKEYIDGIVPLSTKDQKRYNRSKAMEATYNNEWRKVSVNINDIVKKFAPNPKIKRSGMKLYFTGKDYEVRADLAAGYLRIRKRKTMDFITLDGAIGVDSNTHFKILKRKDI